MESVWWKLKSFNSRVEEKHKQILEVTLLILDVMQLLCLAANENNNSTICFRWLRTLCAWTLHIPLVILQQKHIYQRQFYTFEYIQKINPMQSSCCCAPSCTFYSSKMLLSTSHAFSCWTLSRSSFFGDAYTEKFRQTFKKACKLQ